LLDAVHGAFDCAGVVFQGEPGDHGVQVAAQPGGERAQHRQVGVDGAHPLGERVLGAGQILDHPSEAGDVPDGGVQLGTAGADCLQKHRIGWVEVTRKAGDPTGDLAHCRRPWARRQPRERGRVNAA
jgi:hypothetical protein